MIVLHPGDQLWEYIAGRRRLRRPARARPGGGAGRRAGRQDHGGRRGAGVRRRAHRRRRRGGRGEDQGVASFAAPGPGGSRTAARRGQAAGRRPLGSAGADLRRGLRPQHPHARRARGLGPHPRSRPARPRRARRARMPAAAPAFSAFELAARGPPRHRRGLRARDDRRGAAQGARRAASRSGSRRPTPSSCRLRRAASISSSAATCCGRFRIRRRRSTSGSGSCGRADAWSSSTVSSTPAPAPPAAENARASQEYAAIGDQLPFLGGRSREQIEGVFSAHGLGT